MIHLTNIIIVNQININKPNGRLLGIQPIKSGMQQSTGNRPFSNKKYTHILVRTKFLQSLLPNYLFFLLIGKLFYNVIHIYFLCIFFYWSGLEEEIIYFYLEISGRECYVMMGRESFKWELYKFSRENFVFILNICINR